MTETPTNPHGVRAKMPADVDAPDKVVYGLTFRQLAILATAAAAGYTAWRLLNPLVPAPVLLAAALLCGGLAFAVAVGRRDGLPLDRWLLAAIRHTHTPRRLSTMDDAVRLPDWVQAAPSRLPLPAPLRLPADAVDDDGVLHLGGDCAAIVAATTVNLHLRTTHEQAALVDGFGRWLNSLSTPTQIVVSAQPVDLHSAADTVAATADQLPHPALAAACRDHAVFLADLAARRDPLRRQVLVVSHATAAERERTARRRADDTVRALAALGATARTLDAPATLAALAAAADPYRPARPGAPAAPDTVITAAPSPRRGDQP